MIDRQSKKGKDTERDTRTQTEKDGKRGGKNVIESDEQTHKQTDGCHNLASLKSISKAKLFS